MLIRLDRARGTKRIPRNIPGISRDTSHPAKAYERASDVTSNVHSTRASANELGRANASARAIVVSFMVVLFFR